MNRLSTFKERLVRFLFQAGRDTWVTVLRLGFGLAVTLYAFSLRNDWNYLLAGTTGLVDRNLSEALLSLDTHLTPRLGWLVALGELFGLTEQMVLSIAWFCLLGAGCMLLLGLACRFNAILAWLFICRSEKRCISGLWRGSVHDHRAFLSYVVAAAGSYPLGLASY